MNLFDKSLRLALLAGASLLIACPPGDKDETGDASDADTDADSDTDTDSDTDADTDSDVETGLVMAYFLGDFATSAGEFTSGSFGIGYYGLGMEDWACSMTGDLPYEGEAAAGCPDCDWSFDLGPITGSVGTGDYCDQMGLADGSFDTYFDYSWGYAPVYYYDYAGTPLALEQSLMLYGSDGWFAFAFNYNGRDWVYGDAEALSTVRPVFSSSGYVYYYYYPY